VGAFSTEEGRYRLLWVPSALQLKQGEGPNLSQQQFMQALARKPGLKLGETRQLAHQYRVGIRGLARMEKLGIVGSFRDGLSRRFYVREMLNGSRDELPTLVMLCILENPGIWEAQLAKQLGLSQQIVHYHLKKLRDAGVIKATTDTEGARKLYRVV
jgi:predicted transcriptional regulator